MVEWNKIKRDFETAKGPTQMCITRPNGVKHDFGAAKGSTQVCGTLSTGAGSEGPRRRGGEPQGGQQDKVECGFGAAGGIVHVRCALGTPRRPD